MDDRAGITHLLLPLWQQLSPELGEKLRQAQAELTEAQDQTQQWNLYFRFSAKLARLSGKKALENTHWRCDQLSRLQLIQILALTNGRWPSAREERGCLNHWVPALFQQSDTEEKIVLLKALPYLDTDGQLVPFSLLASRTNDPKLFSGLLLNNDYAITHFDTKGFHQILLKALFMDLDISQVSGLSRRLNAELSQLAIDLVMERVYANRKPPPSIWLAIRGCDMDAAFRTTYLGFLASNEENCRYYSALALLLNGVDGFDERLTQQLQQQIKHEPSELIRQTQHCLLQHLLFHLGCEDQQVNPIEASS
jgi:hypothetical protein